VKDKRETATPAELNCQRLGDLACLAVPVDAPSPGAGQWAEIDRRLNRGWSLRSVRRPWPALAVSAVAILCTAGYLVARRPLGYRVVDCALAADGVFATTAVHTGAIVFDDGSRMSVEKDARFRLDMLSFGHGADISLEEGDAHLAVVHQPGARWSVQAGPFRIDVTGTRFDVRWSRPLGRFQLTMVEGEVLVAGGAIPPATHLRTGQTLSADLMTSSFTIADTPSRLTEAHRADDTYSAKTTSAEPVRQDSGAPRGSRPLPPATPARKRTAIATRNPHLTAAGTQSVQVEALPPPSIEPVRALVPSPLFSTPAVAAPVAPKPSLLRVVFGADGQLSNGFTGETSVEGGEGTSFSAPASWNDRSPLRPEAELLCASGTVAALVCVNENLPKMHCNWDSNWGVAIGWYARADHKSWGDAAVGAIAVDFRGRSASYRLEAHLKGDPKEKMYCIDNYKSGQVVRPSMFKSECWADKGDTLADFHQVDLFNLLFPSAMSYVAFRYCVSGITLFP